jgi:hypothetical protein
MSRSLKADRVPEAEDVPTPAALRTLLRGEEAARRRQEEIDQFAARHREEIDEVLRDLSTATRPAQES